MAVAMLAPIASAQTAETWDQFQGGSTHPGTAEGPPPPYRVRWTLPAPGGDALGPAVLDEDRVYTLGREAVYAVARSTGDVEWETPRAGPVLSAPAIAPPPASGSLGAPTVIVFVDGPATREASTTAPATSTPTASPTPDGTDADASSTLVAVDSTNGEERWRLPLPAVSRTGVTVVGSTAYVGTERGDVVAVDTDTGDERWTVMVPDPTSDAGDDGAVVDRAIAADESQVAVVAGSRDRRSVIVASLDAATGEPRFDPLSFPIGRLATAPTIAGDQLLVGMADRLVHALHAEDGSEAWGALTLAHFSPASTLAVAGDAVFAADIFGGVYRFDASSGARVWSFQTNELVLRGAPVTVGGDAVLLGLADGRLVAIDAVSSHLRWQGRSPGLTGPIAVGADAIVAVKGGRDAGLVAYEADPSGTLVDVPSPTEPDPAAALATAGVGAVIALVVVLVPGMLLRRRFGPVVEGGVDEEPDGEPLDDEVNP